MKILPAAGLALATLLLGCGDDGGSSTPDAFIIHDMGIDARVCGTGTTSMLDFGSLGTQSISWTGQMSGLGSADLTYLIEFWEMGLSGTIDLGTGDQTNYRTCSVCVIAFSLDSQGQIDKTYFQSGGSITLSEDPFTNKHLIASLTDLQLEEVTIAQTAESTPVPGGACANFAPFMLDHDRVPNAWTCTHDDYDAGASASCNCVCGTPDPDCTINNTPVVGCTTAMPACFNDACVTPPTNDTCAAATPITIGTPVMGTTAGAQRNYSMGLDDQACTGFPQPGPDVVYSVALTAGQAITVSLSGIAATYDASVSLVGPGADTVCSAMPITACVAGADDAYDGENESFMYTATTAGTYYIIIDGFGIEDGGAFTLGVTSP